MPPSEAFGEVRAGAEHPVGGPDHHHDRVVVRGRPVEPLEQLGRQLPGQRVAVVRESSVIVPTPSATS
jgi:hypothetical protein